MQFFRKISLRVFEPRVVVWLFALGCLFAVGMSCGKNEQAKTNIAGNAVVPSKPGINFLQGTWSDVVAEAKKQNKHIFLDTYADWCSPCIWMEKNIFVKENVGRFYNEKFVSYRMDMEKGEGIELYKKWGLTGYPSFMFFKPDGELIHHTQGSEDTEDRFIQVGKDALDENKALFAIKAKYEANKRDPAITLKYLLGLKKAYLFMNEYRPIMDDYVKNQPQPIPITPENWLFLKELVTDIAHPFYQDLLKREADYENPFGKNETKRAIYTTQMNYYSGKKDWKTYSISATGYLDSVDPAENSVLVSIAWTFIDNVKDKKLLQKIQARMQKTVEASPTYDNLQTNAHLLSELRNNQEAIKQAELAIVKAKEANQEYESTEKWLAKIR